MGPISVYLCRKIGGRRLVGLVGYGADGEAYAASQWGVPVDAIISAEIERLG